MIKHSLHPLRRHLLYLNLNSRRWTSLRGISRSTPVGAKYPGTHTAIGEASLPEGLKLFDAEPIHVRKSTFIGHACRIEDPSQVPLVLSYVMQDKRTARASHPTIYAWRCVLNGSLKSGEDDCGETAAGHQLARLLELLNVDNVLVVVTRSFGEVKLGPSRFKYIKQAAQGALKQGGLVKDR